jgi:hypothetical protein
MDSQLATTTTKQTSLQLRCGCIRSSQPQRRTRAAAWEQLLGLRKGQDGPRVVYEQPLHVPFAQPSRKHSRDDLCENI